MPARATTPANIDIAISVRNVGKMYRIYDRPQDRLKQMLWRGRRMYGHEFWALRNVSFDVHKGETLGIIGRNGSGKSTLLQIIAGTLAPTEGEVQVSGRVAALLELGSGFNPEFTGRENVYLNAAILGLSTAETDALYDDIAAFADIGEFIDQPVKFYSSGMMLRLAFAVQAQVDPDILIVDEALAVGDFAFQHKCMSKIKELQRKGVSILLVSHDIGAIKAHCSHAVMLEHGRVYVAGDPDEVGVTYFHRVIEEERRTTKAAAQQAISKSTTLVPNVHQLQGEAEAMFPIQATTRRGLGQVQYQGIKLMDAYNKPITTFEFGDWMVIELLLAAEQNVEQCYPGFLIKDLHGNYLMGLTTWALGELMPPLQAGEFFKIRFSTQLFYRPGNYSIIINNAIDNMGTDFYDWCDNVVQFTILEGDYRQPPYGYGMFCPPTRVELEHVTSTGG